VLVPQPVAILAQGFVLIASGCVLKLGALVAAPL